MQTTLAAAAQHISSSLRNDDRIGTFEARLESGPLVCRSRQPFLDAARRLIDAGHSPSAVLIMRHAGSGVDALRARLCDAARLTATERDRGVVRLEVYRAVPSFAGTSRIAQTE